VEEKVEAKRPSLDSSGCVRWSSGQLPRNATGRMQMQQACKAVQQCSRAAEQHNPRDAVDGGQGRGMTKRRGEKRTSYPEALRNECGSMAELLSSCLVRQSYAANRGLRILTLAFRRADPCPCPPPTVEPTASSSSEPVRLLNHSWYMGYGSYCTEIITVSSMPPLSSTFFWALWSIPCAHARLISSLPRSRSRPRPRPCPPSPESP
jgi:hypothetical protein